MNTVSAFDSRHAVIAVYMTSNEKHGTPE